MTRSVFSRLLWLTLVAPLGCYTGSYAEGDGETAGEDEAAPVDPQAVNSGPMPLRRLTRVEYDNTVRDLLGDDIGLGQKFSGELVGSSGFSTPGLVSTVDATALMEAAEQLSLRAATRLDALLPCDPAALGDDDCASEFITGFGRRAFRRPLDDIEYDALVELYQQARTDLGRDFAGGIEVVLQAILQSPQFLYHWQLGSAQPEASGDVVALGPHELASRLSYFLWSTMPDDALFEAADADALGSDEEIEAQVRRMLADPKAKDTLATFHRQWLDIDHLLELPKDPELFPEWDDELKVSMEAETLSFINHVILAGDGRLGTLLTASFSFINEPLARLYGVEGVTGTDIRGPVDLDPAERMGVLTHASVLAHHARAYEGSPIHRGKLIRERLLCQTLPIPPANIPPLEGVDPSLPSRERYEAHFEEEPCRTCHLLMDLTGFGFENYDTIGRYRSTDAGLPVDASGTVYGLDGEARSFEDVRELVELLAASEQVKRCVVTQWFRFAMSRKETAEEQVLLDNAYAAFEASDFDIREMLVAIAMSPAFRYRQLSEGELRR